MAMLNAASHIGLTVPNGLNLKHVLKRHLQSYQYLLPQNKAALCMALVFNGVLLGFGTVAQAEIYQWTDANGKVHYTDRPDETAVAKSGGTVKKVETKINTFESVDVVAIEDQPAAKTVEMYATQWCGYCKKARRYMAQKGIAYIEYDIETDAAANARHKALGGRGVPLILVDGRRLNGFSESGFERVYSAN